jgi:hypothetical protein
MCLSPRPGMPSTGTPCLSPGSFPSGEGPGAGIERRAPERVEVVPKALSSSSAVTVLFRSGALPGFQTALRAEPLSSARRVPPGSFAKAPLPHNNKAKVKLRFLLMKVRDLHIRHTEYPLLCPQRFSTSVDIRAARDELREAIQAFEDEARFTRGCAYRRIGPASSPTTPRRLLALRSKAGAQQSKAAGCPLRATARRDEKAP